MSRPVYAVITNCNIQHGRITTSSTKIHGGDGYSVRSWKSVLEMADQEMRSRYGDPVVVVTVAMVTSDDSGAVKSTPVKRCASCDCFKVPGERHRHDPRKGPKKGNVLRVDRSVERWDDGGNFDEMCGAKRDDPRWTPIKRGFTVKVLSVVTEPAWTWEGRTFPSRVEVKYTITLTGDWSGDDDHPSEGDGEVDLPEWREWLREAHLAKKAS